MLCLLIFLWDGLRRAREDFLGGGFGGEVWFGESWFDSVFVCLFGLFCLVCLLWMAGWLGG